MLCPHCKTERTEDGAPCASCGAVLDPFVGRVLQDKLEIKRRLGQGGFGAVYEAYHRELESKIAIKILHAGLLGSSQAAERFRREALTTSKLQSPSVVKVFDRGNTQDGILWLAMEFIQGETLGERIRRQKSIPERELVEILGPICEALQEAHQKGIIHRDLKPENIMLSTLENGRTFPKILDFGIAALRSDGSLTQSDSISGTPKYMAPEQWEGLKNTDARSDIYALGVIAYQCLSGELPFFAETPFAWMNLHYNAAPSPLRERMGGLSLSASMEAAVMKALEKNPSDRPASALAFYQMITQEAPPAPSAAAPSEHSPPADSNSAELAGALQPAQGDSSFSKNLSRASSRWWLAALSLTAGLAFLVYNPLSRPGPKTTPPPTNPSTQPQSLSASQPKTQESASQPQSTSLKALTSAELAAEGRWELAAALAQKEGDIEKAAHYLEEALAQKDLQTCRTEKDLDAALEACLEISPTSSFNDAAEEEVDRILERIQRSLDAIRSDLQKNTKESLMSAKRQLDAVPKTMASSPEVAALRKEYQAKWKALPPDAETLYQQALDLKKAAEIGKMCQKLQQYAKSETDLIKLDSRLKEIDDEVDFSRYPACKALTP